MSNLKLGRWGKKNWLTLSRRFSNWWRLQLIYGQIIFQYTKCFTFITKSHTSSNRGTHLPNHLCKLCKVNRRKCRHLSSTSRTSSIEAPVSQRRWTSVMFSADSNSKKSCGLASNTDIRSICIWWHFLKIYEEVSSVSIIGIVRNVTTFRLFEFPPLTWSSFRFLRRSISTFKSIHAFSVRVWILKQAARIRLTNSKKKKEYGSFKAEKMPLRRFHLPAEASTVKLRKFWAKVG